eukprot:1158469-Pelagomonas_calceolata.AAC.2
MLDRSNVHLPLNHLGATCTDPHSIHHSFGLPWRLAGATCTALPACPPAPDASTPARTSRAPLPNRCRSSCCVSQSQHQ